MVEDDVEDDAHALGVGGIHQLDQVLPCAETRVDVEEVLDRVAVKGVEVGALLEDRADPERGDAQAPEITQLRGDAGDRAALVAIAAALRPLVEAEAGRPCTGRFAAIQQRPAAFLAVAEPIGQQEVDDFVAPVGGRREESLAARQIDRTHTRGPGLAQHRITKRHHQTFRIAGEREASRRMVDR